MSSVPDDSHMDMSTDACFGEFVDARTLSLVPPSSTMLPAQNDGSFNPDLVDPALTPMMDMDGAPQYPPLSHSAITSIQLSTTATPVGQPAAQSQPQAPVQTIVAAPQGQSEAIPRRSTRAVTGNGSQAQSHPSNQTPTATSSQGSSGNSQPTHAAQSTTGASSSQTASQTAPPADNAEDNGGGEHAAEQDEKDMIRWTPETRYELLLQVAYERRHESMSEAAWHRIARGSRGGPWMEASWNGVR